MGKSGSKKRREDPNRKSPTRSRLAKARIAKNTDGRAKKPENDIEK